MGEVTPEKVRAFLEEKALKAEKDFWGKICALYVFGSTATGRGWKREKDLDIAVYFSPERFKVVEGEEIAEGMERAFEIKVDVVILNIASPLMRYEVFKNGKLVYSSDESRRVDFEVKSLLEFYDLELLRKRFVQDMKRLIREGKF